MNKKMKTGIAITLLVLMLLSLVSSGLVLAESGSGKLGLSESIKVTSGKSNSGEDIKDVKIADEKDKSREKSRTLVEIETEIEDDEFETEDLGKRELRKAFVDVDASVDDDVKEATFASVHRGEGWAISENNLGFVRIMWVEKTFVNGDETTKAQGIIKLSGSNAAKMVLVSSTENSLTFTAGTGTLVLTKDKSLSGFTLWKGTLTLDKVHEITLATKDSKVVSTNVEIERTKVESSANANLSAGANALIEEIKASFSSSQNVEIKFEKEDSTIKVVTEGILTSEQQSLVNELKAELETLSLEEGFELEIQHEVRSKIGLLNRIKSFFSNRGKGSMNSGPN